MKPKDPVWNFFIIIDEGNKKIAKCINCDSVVSSKVERLKAHFQVFLSLKMNKDVS